ncbi:MAG: small ribosomal subunit Rsm22 family protein [Opitutaceae bacterium]
MTWEELDWEALARLRRRFIGEEPFDGPYWVSESELASYDFTYGERIGWKWDQVLRELRWRGWSPPAGPVLDWGCGSGVATRRLLREFGAGWCSELILWDHSPLAADFAVAAAAREFAGLSVAQATPGLLAGQDPVGLLVISHVLNELPPGALESLLALVARATAVIWVESGTSTVSRALGAIRERLRAEFSVVAPCTHENACPVLAPGRERDWCHFFAPPPAGIFADSGWVKFGQRAGIDLRSLPYSFLALDRRPPAGNRTGLSRVIGRVEHLNPLARWLNCDADGLAELELPKRADPRLFKELERTREPLVYQWRRDGTRVTGGEAAEAAN